MRRLLSLELQKLKYRNLLVTFFSINISIISIFLLVCIDAEASSEFFSSDDFLVLLIELFTMAAFVIYASVLISTLIIDEYKNKTITVLFMYPIDRRKILMTKVMIISGFTFFSMILSSIIIYYSFYFLNNLFGLTTLALPFILSLPNILHILLTSIATTGISLIPIFFGMIKYSVPATITSSILIVTILSSILNNDTNLYYFLGATLFLGAIGFIVAYSVINKAVKIDL